MVQRVGSFLRFGCYLPVADAYLRAAPFGSDLDAYLPVTDYSPGVSDMARGYASSRDRYTPTVANSFADKPWVSIERQDVDVQHIAIGRLLRMVRIRREWRQSDVAERARVSASVVARHERGMINSLAMLDRHASALDVRLDLRLLGRSGHLVRMADEEHAAIVESIADWLRRSGFQVQAEASFSEWGERGRIDLLAYDPHAGTVVIVEVKTLLLDLQELLGGLDVRERLVAVIARRRGWRIERRVTMLAVAASAANRTVVRSHSALFQPFTVRRLGQSGLDAAGRILVWITPQRMARRTWVTGRERVRRRSVRSA